MAVAVRSTSTLTFNAGRTNSTFTAPAGIVNGDILLIVMNIGDATGLPPLTATPPAGFTEAPGSPSPRATADPYTISIRVYWKKAASESGSYTVSHTAAGTEGVLYCLSGADGTAPLTPAPTFLTDGNPGVANGQTTTATGLTTPAAGCLVIMSEALYDDTQVGGTPMVPPTGTTPTFTERYKGTIMYLSDGVMASAGATGNKSHTNGNNGAGAPWVSTLICVQVPTAATPKTQVKVAGVWKPATTFVKVAGVWKPASPFVKVAGVWKPL